MAAQFNFMNARPHRELRLWIARAINSLPVPVSPSIRTVESVGATRSTCSSTASRAGLLPMICSNLRRLSSWSPDLDLPKASTEISCLRVHSSLSVLTLHRCPNTLEQCLIVERFRQELHCARSHRLQAHFRVAVCGYK